MRTNPPSGLWPWSPYFFQASFEFFPFPIAGPTPPLAFLPFLLGSTSTPLLLSLSSSRNTKDGESTYPPSQGNSPPVTLRMYLYLETVTYSTFTTYYWISQTIVTLSLTYGRPAKPNRRTASSSSSVLSLSGLSPPRTVWNPNWARIPQTLCCWSPARSFYWLHLPGRRRTRPLPASLTFVACLVLPSSLLHYHSATPPVPIPPSLTLLAPIHSV